MTIWQKNLFGTKIPQNNAKNKFINFKNNIGD